MSPKTVAQALVPVLADAPFTRVARPTTPRRGRFAGPDHVWEALLDTLKAGDALAVPCTPENYHSRRADIARASRRHAAEALGLRIHTRLADDHLTIYAWVERRVDGEE